jgi:hypothetical protein
MLHPMLNLLQQRVVKTSLGTASNAAIANAALSIGPAGAPRQMESSNAFKAKCRSDASMDQASTIRAQCRSFHPV